MKGVFCIEIIHKENWFFNVFKHKLKSDDCREVSEQLILTGFVLLSVLHSSFFLSHVFQFRFLETAEIWVSTAAQTTTISSFPGISPNAELVVWTHVLLSTQLFNTAVFPYLGLYHYGYWFENASRCSAAFSQFHDVFNQTELYCSPGEKKC